MKTRSSPFVLVDGQPHLITNFDLEPADDIPLLQLLEKLLHHHDPAEILILRPLTKAEQRILRTAAEERDREAWARMVVQAEDRFRGRR